MLGNPVVVGAASAQAITGESSDFVVAGKAKDTGALDDLIDKLNPKKVGEASGATIYQDGDTFIAVKDDMVVSANDEAQLKAALERADGDGHLSEDTFNQALEGLPDSALARVYTDLEALLKSDPGSVDARKVKWIGALRTLGLTVSAKSDSVDVDFRARTEGDLTDADLPIAPGDESPPVIKRPGEIGVGIRDLAHIVRFAENAGQAINPAGFGDYARAKATIDKQLGISLDDDLIGQLTGNLSASVAPGRGFGLRSELKDPQAFRRTLAKVADVLPSFAEGAGFGKMTLTKPKSRRGLLRAQASGRRLDRVRRHRRRAGGRQRCRARPRRREHGSDGRARRERIRRRRRRCRAAGRQLPPALRLRARDPRRRGARDRAPHTAAGRPERQRLREHQRAARQVHAGHRVAQPRARAVFSGGQRVRLCGWDSSRHHCHSHASRFG